MGLRKMKYIDIFTDHLSLKAAYMLDRHNLSFFRLSSTLGKPLTCSNISAASFITLMSLALALDDLFASHTLTTTYNSYSSQIFSNIQI